MWHVQPDISSSDIHHSIDANRYQSHQRNEYGNGQWGDVGGYSTGWAQYDTTPMQEYKGYDFETPPVMPIKFTYIAPDPPPPVSVTSISTTVTPVTTTGDPTPRRTLTDDDRRRMCEYYESHPDAKQTEIGAVFSVDRSTVSKILRRKEKFLYSNDGSQSPAKKAKGKFKQKNKPLDAKPEKGHSFFHEPNGIHVVDSSTTSLSKMPNSCSSVLSDSGEMVSSPTSPLPRSENTSPVSSVGSPTQGDARRALDLVWSFFQNQPAGILEPDEYATIGKLMVKLKLSHGPDRTPVLPGSIYPVDRSLSPRVSKKRTIDGIYSHDRVAV